MGIVRVQLHHEHHYAAFHAAMLELGFSQTIVGRDGQEYRLPRATYWMREPTTATAMREAARAAAVMAEVPRPAHILATSGSSAWSGLEVVDDH
jgi:hypothetical protein